LPVYVGNENRWCVSAWAGALAVTSDKLEISPANTSFVRVSAINDIRKRIFRHSAHQSSLLCSYNFMASEELA
jgi:hypothetical protein